MTLRSRVALLVLGWLAYALFFSTQAWLASAGSTRQMPWPRVFGVWLICAAIWAAFTPVVLALLRRFPLVPRRHRVRNTIVHLAASAAVSAAAHALFVLIVHGATAEAIRGILMAEFHVGLIIYWALVAISMHVEKRVAAAELERSLQQARLDALRMQLQPHFLFNTLSSIAILVDEEPETARSMIVRLSELLRSTIDDAGRNEVTLREELEVLERYLDIERLRFRDRLAIVVDVDPAALDCRVPPFLLQPLVENALRHGIGAHAGAGRITISARVDDGALALRVTDDGAGVPKVRREGVGLASVRERLAHLYPAEHSMALHNRDPRGCEVSITIPTRRAAA
ncbi:MAG TPA: histidine kinase [Thermoanaerobaculia bacterium]|jgi:LytS/YehU family sensor histidine kinase